jgi:ribosome-binding ATPase
MRIALAGQPGSGKSSLFDLLVWREGQDERRRLAAAEQSGLRIAHVEIPDPRVEALARAYKPRKTTPARLEFLDLEQKSGPPYPGLTPQRREMLAHADLILLVIDLAGEERSDWGKCALAQWRAALDEYILLDQATVEGRLERMTKLLRIGQDTGAPGEAELLADLRQGFEEGRTVHASGRTPEQERLLRGYSFLSDRPVLPAFHLAEDDLAHSDEALAAAAGPLSPRWTYFCAPVERQIRELPSEDQEQFLQAFGLRETALGPIIRQAYHQGGFHCFFTVGEDEVRAWGLRQGASVREAAGVIHTDLERGFVRAEVLSYSEWESRGSHDACREAGLVRLEGKDYTVFDGDILNIRSGLARNRG